MATVESLIARQRELRAAYDARMDGTPNLRDYGFERRPEFEAALAAYHAESQRMWAELESIVRQRHALLAAQRTILANR
jgi:hypothetical protein